VIKSTKQGINLFEQGLNLFKRFDSSMPLCDNTQDVEMLQGYLAH
jgi:hypothetical protein